jgi:hypothetical protein
MTHVCNLSANTTERSHHGPTVNRPSLKRVPSKTGPKNFDRTETSRQYIGGIILDYFIVLVCVVVIGVPALAYIVWKFTRVQGPTFAGYRLLVNKTTATQAEQTFSGHDQRQAVAVQLIVLNPGEQV